jgi:hypothetical protein
MTRTLTIIFIGLFFLVGCNQRRNEPPIKALATDLEADYKESASRADEKYVGRTLIVTGVIAHFAELRGVVGIYLERANPEGEWRVICLVEKASQPDVYSKLRQGQSATFVGIGYRVEDESLIRITDCKVE